MTVAEIRGEITRSTLYMVQEVLTAAIQSGSRLVVFYVNTPGGELGAVSEIMNLFELSWVPVCVFVSPFGSTAWSGGTYLLMASHIAAMSSGTVIGSCQPVMGGQPVYDTKYVNAMAALMVAHARLHSRNETVASQFVYVNLNLLPEQAKESGVVEVVADSLPELFSKLEGKALIQYVNNETGTLSWMLVDEEDAESYNPSRTVTLSGISGSYMLFYPKPVKYQVLDFLVNPYVAYSLLMLGIFGLIIGIKTPGYGAEVGGSISLLLSLIGLGVLGLNVAALLFFTLGFILLILELKTGTSVLAVGGVVCLVLGSLMVVPAGWLFTQSFVQSLTIVLLTVSGLLAAFFGFLVYKVSETRKLKSELEPEELVGAEGVAKTMLNPRGQVLVRGEIWSARSADGSTIPEGSRVRVVGVSGLTLMVEKS
ncbi:MAG: nodulation protein NfeD [Candidatus Freyarchaeota archaeon]|nr:nodulation protein NfeD [Candidatus Jordarchaeia archaeon]